MSKLRIYLEIYGEYLVCWGRLMKNTIFDFQPAETGLEEVARAGDDAVSADTTLIHRCTTVDVADFHVTQAEPGAMEKPLEERPAPPHTSP